MGQVIHRPIAWSERIGLDTLVREINQALRDISQQVTLNYFYGYPMIAAAILSNTTQTIWIPTERCVVESITLRTSSGTASVTPRINTTNMGVSGGVPITATTTPTTYAITSANEVDALDDVDCVVSGLAGSARVTLGINVRRMQ